MVGDAVLREIVGPDLLRALAGADLRPPGGRLLRLLPLPLDLVQPRSQHAQRLLLVLELGLLVLHRDDEARRQVRDPDGRVGRVHALTARAGRAVDVDLEVVRIDLHLDLLGLGHHRDRGRGRVDAALRLGGGHALDAVGPALPLEDRVGAVALDREGDLLEAARLARARAEDLRREPAALRVARQHPQNVGGPERRPRPRRRPGGSRR